MQIGVETSRAVDQRRVFVIDEDDVTRAALQFILQDEIETHELASPEDAYEKGDDWLKPDLILLGISFLANHRPDLIATILARFPAVRILLVCSQDESNIALGGLKAGAHGTLVKPLTIAGVRRKVDTMLGRRSGHSLTPLSGPGLSS